MTKPPCALPLLIPLLLAAFLLTPTTAEIKSLTITEDARAMILFEKFGFTPTGHVIISVHSVNVGHMSPNAPNPIPSRLGFFLLSEESLLQVLLEIQQNPNFCVLDSHYILPLFTFRDLSPPPLSAFNQSYPVTAPNEYSLFFANCAPETKVSMSVRTEVFNLDRDGSRDYLSAGLTHLPSLYTLYSLTYIAFLAIWIYVCYHERNIVQRIHLVMGLLLLFKALNLICAAEDKHYIKVTGTAHGWDVLFYIFQFIRVVLLFTVIVLIGTGWSFLKPYLQEKEKKVLMIVVPLQVLANLASVVIGETGPFIKDWVTWNQVFLLVDIICCCAIIFPIVWSIRSLRETSKTDGKAARNLNKLQLFRQFYILVIFYLYFTRIVVFALKTIAAYKYQWVSNAAEETASLVFYVVMFHMFRPVVKNEYFLVDDETEEAAEVALKDEDFDL
ncbi:Protein CANDIDATE G-PROTEIN COUPLED REPTOR 7 [Turnera subulata]|uniref:Protein CANDIDATE G-PROTEIN COUPLED REPTOR 7 n=1 Tax=Turnera subulata TaxID=218843 RepID=A0A9Q0J7S6_9ROSI|nr:Protein CANDIDATE G-PROTEIN COUPLED REPTOR 7 [Turnera subulata]